MLRQLTRFCVRYAERYIPDPYLYAVILTFLTVVAAWIWTPSDAVKIIELLVRTGFGPFSPSHCRWPSFL